MKDNGKFALNPIKFKNNEYVGTFGSDWLNTNYILTSLITQNVLYSAYHEAKTIPEIANLLGIQIDIIEEEIEFLEDNGFMDKISSDKYVTNILIHDISNDVNLEMKKVYKKYAKTIYDVYIKHLLESCEGVFTSDKINTPENDYNYFLWTIITLNLCRKLTIPSLIDSLKKHYIKQNDGCDYMLLASLDRNDKMEQFQSYGQMYFLLNQDLNDHFSMWRFNSSIDTRKKDWGQTLVHPFLYLHEILKNKIKNDSANADKFEVLINEGVIVLPEDQVIPVINMLVSTVFMDDLLNLFPNIPNEFKELNARLSSEIYNICESQYPKHKQELCYDFYQNSISKGELIMQILEILLTNGILKPLTESQKKTVNMIFFCDRIEC